MIKGRQKWISVFTGSYSRFLVLITEMQGKRHQRPVASAYRHQWIIKYLMPYLFVRKGQ